MNQLHNKKILLGITGGIAAYKTAELVRNLKERGADVRVAMTKAAQEFVTPLTLQALSGNPVHCQLLDPTAEAAMGHIELARWADLIIVAPTSADFMAKLASGHADNLLSTLCLATTKPIAIAPAMNQAMWKNKATQANLQTLIDRDIKIWGPADGAQACGDIGPGRMAEPAQLTEYAENVFLPLSLNNINLVITAGPTREAIDPVRYISNHSSGKMGFALAQAAVQTGANVTLITGPVSLDTPENVTRIDVESALQMYEATMQATAHSDIFIAAAAVADYRPIVIENQKIKKNTDTMKLELTRNIDIVSSVSSSKSAPFTVGFAAETQHLEKHAQQKLLKKNLDMIIANDVSNSEIGFNSNNNAVTIFWPGGKKSIPTTNKKTLGHYLLKEIATHYTTSNKITKNK